MPLLNALLESGQVNLIDSTLADVHINGETVNFLVVQEEMLQTTTHTALLHILDIRHSQLTSQVGVLTHILEAASIEWHTCYGGSRPQQQVFATESEFLADGSTIDGRHLTVPCGSKASK